MNNLNKTNMEPTESHQLIDKSNVVTANSRWNWLYKIAGAAALITAVIFPLQIIVFVAWPPPLEGTVIDWFTLFQDNRLLGLLSMDLLIIADYALLIPIFLALYVTLKRSSKSFMAIGTTLGFIGLAAYFASNTAFNMLSLSDQYAAATTDAQRAMFLAAGQAMLAIYQGTAFHVSYFLVGIAGIIISAVMLRSKIFSKKTAYLGILGNVIGFGLYMPPIGVYIAIFSVLFLEIWYILVARRLFQLARFEKKSVSQ